MCTPTQLDYIAKRIAACYRETYGDSVVEIILYGSYARGDETADSDIDIVAIVRGERLELQEKLKLIWDISADIGLENDAVISPMVIPYDEYMNYRKILPFYRNIAEEGRKIG